MNRIDVINSLIQKYGLKKYCEIGVQAGDCFSNVICEHKVGVDPDLSSKATIFKTSDEFFETLDEKFDIFWIDGLHHSEFVYRDILNALEHLNEGGFICCHDMLPTNKFMQEIPLTSQCEWTGDCWRAFVKLRTERNDLQMNAINTDWGTSIIVKGSQELLVIDKPLEDLTYEDFEQNKQQWLNVISVDEFKQKFL